MVIVVIALFWVFQVHKRATVQARKELVELFELIEPGISRETFDTFFEKGEYSTLRLNHISTEESLVRTPLEWGARNWLMWLEVDHNRIAAMRIRYQDSRAESPAGAPDDKIAISDGN